MFQAVSGVISVIKTGLWVCRLLSTPRLSNETAAKSSNNMFELFILGTMLFWRKIKITDKALYDDTWPESLGLQFHPVSAYNLRSLEAPKLAI